MEKQFVTYEIALKLKELGFDEECCALYRKDRLYPILGFEKINSTKQSVITAPLWQQVFDWLFSKLNFYCPNIKIEVFSDDSGSWYQSEDNMNEYIDINFNNKEQAVLGAIKLLEKTLEFNKLKRK